MVRGVLWLVRKLLLVTPCAFILFWGYSYLKVCLLVLLAPGKPVEFAYQAPEGDVLVRADSYNLDVNRGKAIVRGFSVHSPNGGVVASASRIEVSNLKPNRGASQSPIIDIYGLSGSLVRLKSGRFELENLIPPSKGKSTSNFPYRVHVHGANVVLKDYKGEPWIQRAVCGLINISGAGSSWVAWGNANAPGMGSGTVSIVNDANVGIRVQGQTESVDGTAIFRHILSDRSIHALDKIRGLKVGRVQVGGPFQVFVPSNLKATFKTKLIGSASNVAFQKYRLDRVAFAGSIGMDGAVAHVKLNTYGSTAEGEGSVRFKDHIEAAGKFSLSCASSKALPAEIQKAIPSGLNFQDAKFNGWVSYKAGGQPTAQGTLIASKLSFRNEVAANSKVDVFGTPSGIRADLLQTQVAGSVPRGTAQVDLKKKTLVAYVQGGKLELSTIGRLTHAPGISGEGSVQALVSGSLLKPQIDFLAEGVGSYKKDKISLGPDTVQVAGRFKDNMFDIHRGYVHGKDGLLAVSGQGTSRGSALDLDVEARNIHPGNYLAGLEGVASLSANVSGDYRNPKAVGVVRAVDLSYQGQTVPVAVADFTADRNRVAATRIGAISGTIDLEGQASLGLQKRDLKGKLSVTGVELAQFLGEQAAGIVDVPTIQLSGTITHPSVVARMEGSNLVFGDVLIDGVEALIAATPQKATVDHVTANFAGGSVSLTGGYDIAGKSGQGVITSTALDLEKLAPALGTGIALKGSASIKEAKVAYQNGQVTGTAEGQIDKIIANGVPVGDGNWTAQSDGTIVKGNVSIGQVEPVLRVVDLDAAYNLKDKTINGSFDANRTYLRDIVAASLRYLPETWTANSTNLFNLTGDLTVGAKFSGPISAPDVSVETFTLANLKYKDTPFGNLTATNIERKNKVWTAPQVALSGPEGKFTASGTASEDGTLSAEVAGSGIKASSLSSLVPGLAGSKAEASFTAKATGSTSAPNVVASVDLEHLVQAPENKDAKLENPDLWVKAPSITLTNGLLALKGTYGFDGFSGSFDGNAPITIPKGLGDGVLHGHVQLDRRTLKDLPLVGSVVDLSRSQGSVGGDITVDGPLSALAFQGGLDFSADSLGFRFANPDAYISRIDDQFKSVVAKLSITKSHDVNLSLSATAVRGGEVVLNTTASLPDLSAMSQSDLPHIEEALRKSSLSGSFQLNNLAIRQSAPGGYVSATINGKTPIGGTVGYPEIGTRSEEGQFVLSNVDTVIPKFPTAQPNTSTSTPNIGFNLGAKIAGSAHVKSATAEVNLTGDASLKGTLADPLAKGDLVVASGTVRLPGSPIRLTPGGTINFAYQRAFPEDSTASLDVDLEGKTSVTSIRYGQTTQRYDITVDITGNALQDNGLHFDAISDPPDLSSDDVLALLGQKNLVENLGNSNQTEAENQLRDALVGFALPSLLDPYTSTLAKGLGLDYISLEYNSVNLATVDVARSINPEFTLQYRQQVGTPPPGYRAIYDFRLVFTPRKGPELLRRLSLSVGTDQDRPWKIALEYGFRFGGYSGTMLRNKTVLSSPEKP